MKKKRVWTLVETKINIIKYSNYSDLQMTLSRFRSIPDQLLIACVQVKMFRAHSSDFSEKPNEEVKEEEAPLNEREVFLEGFGEKEKGRIFKNVLVISVAFMFHFTAFHGTANLQSSLNADSAGTYSLLSIYSSLTLANIFLPVIVIR